MYLNKSRDLAVYIKEDKIHFNPQLNKYLAETLAKVSQSEAGLGVLHARTVLEERSFVAQTKQKNIWHLAIGTRLGGVDNEGVQLWSNTTSKDYVKLKNGEFFELDTYVLGHPKIAILYRRMRTGE